MKPKPSDAPEMRRIIISSTFGSSSDRDAWADRHDAWMAAWGGRAAGGARSSRKHSRKVRAGIGLAIDKLGPDCTASEILDEIAGTDYGINVPDEDVVRDEMKKR